ncbi:hypothetical protein Bbelb_428680 [Branchiostoma belcheri]|nr:hypothetical protein Bbelb_428680 [Branchiostoma belcheri]
MAENERDTEMRTEERVQDETLRQGFIRRVFVRGKLTQLNVTKRGGTSDSRWLYGVTDADVRERARLKHGRERERVKRGGGERWRLRSRSRCNVGVHARVQGQKIHDGGRRRKVLLPGKLRLRAPGMNPASARLDGWNVAAKSFPGQERERKSSVGCHVSNSSKFPRRYENGYAGCER